MRRVLLSPRCRVCGQKYPRSALRCPNCGRATGVRVRLPDHVQPSLAPASANQVESGAEEFALAPAAEPPPEAAPRFQLPPPDPPPPPHPLTLARRFSLADLMIGVTVVAVCLAIGRVSSAAGTILFLLCIPTFVRTLAGITLSRGLGRVIRSQDVFVLAVQSLAFSCVALVAGFVFHTFFILFLATVLHLLGPTAIQIISLVGLFLTVLLMTVMVLVLWPVQEN